MEWAAAITGRADLAIDALEMAVWRGLDDVELATMTYVDRFNHRRLHGQIADDACSATPVA